MRPSYRSASVAIKLGVAVALGLPTPASAEEPAAVKARVVLFSLDGVRHQDLLQATAGPKPNMPTLAALLPGASSFGFEPGSTVVKTPAAKPLSLPGYSAIMAGRLSACLDNRCPRTEVESLMGKSARTLGAPDGHVAVFASWAGIHRAISRAETKHILLDAPTTNKPAPPARPWPDARLDGLTFSKAIEHLEAKWPPLVWISLLDTDEWAHRDRRAEYDQALAEADRRLGELLQKLAAAPDAALVSTTVVITTDHGRGVGPKWTDHGSRDGSERVFLIFYGPKSTRARTSSLGELSLADVRPTIEHLLGLEPTVCDGPSCGRIIPEAVSAQQSSSSH